MNEQIWTLFADSQHEPAVVDLAAGQVAMFSAKSPDRVSANEDAYAVAQIDPETLLLAVADGAGGHPNGDYAARLAIESLLCDARARADLPTRAAIVNGFERGEARIANEIPGAATTLVAAEIAHDTVRTYHVGDSGAVVIGGRGKHKGQTVFHSPTGYAVEAGLLTEEEAIMHASRHLVSNVLGLGNMSVEIGTPADLAERDTVILASDGLYDNLMSDEIAALACGGSIADACHRLIEAVNARMRNPGGDYPGKPDDLTIILYRRHRARRRQR